MEKRGTSFLEVPRFSLTVFLKLHVSSNVVLQHGKSYDWFCVIVLTNN